MKNQNHILKPVARLARLNNRGGDIRKAWFVQYSYRDNISGKMRQFRITKGLNCIKDYNERTEKGKQIVEDLNRQLKNGYNPFEDHEVIYEDQIEKRHWTNKKVPNRKSRQTFRYFSNKYLEQKKIEGIRPGTYTNYKSKFRIFDAWLKTRRMADKDVSAFTHRQAIDFINYLRTERKTGSVTTNQYLDLMNSLFNYIRQSRKNLNNAFSEINRFKKDSKITQYYPDRSIKILKEYFLMKEPQMWLVVQIMYYCYIRPKEIRFLQIKHIRFDEGFIFVPAALSKSRKDRRPLLPDILANYMKELGIHEAKPDDYLITIDHKPGVKPVSKNYLSEHFRKARKKLGLSKDHTFYAWKHTGMVKANQAGIPTKDIQNQAGHHSLDMVDMYLKSASPVESEALRTKFPEI